MIKQQVSKGISHIPSSWSLQDVSTQRSPSTPNEFEIPFLTTPRTTPTDGGTGNTSFEEDIAREVERVRKRVRRKCKVLDLQTELESPMVRGSLKDPSVCLRKADYTKQVSWRKRCEVAGVGPGGREGG